MAMSPLVFVKLLLAPRVSSHCYAQMPMEAHLEGFHPALLLLPERLGKESHGLEDVQLDKKFYFGSKGFKNGDDEE